MMSLTTHAPGEPCVGHCGACGAFADWNEIITDFVEVMKELAAWGIDMEESDVYCYIGYDLKVKAIGTLWRATQKGVPVEVD